MPKRKPARLLRGSSRALLLPMGRDAAAGLVLRTRLFLDRLLQGQADRMAMNHLAQVCVITGFIAREGYRHLQPERIGVIGRALGDALLAYDETGQPVCLPAPLAEGLTDVVNEYDRLLGTVRLELFARASDYLDYLIAQAADETRSA